MTTDEINGEDISPVRNNAPELSPEETPASTERSRRAVRKQKRLEKKRRALLGGEDIRYRGPFSYLTLRVFAWIAIALSQFVALNAVFTTAGTPMMPYELSVALSLFSQLAVPLFMISSFATILNKSRSFKKMLIEYAVFYVGIALALVIVYERYVGVFVRYFTGSDMSLAVGDALGKNLDINVFSDLFALAAFNFFLNYHPTKRFQGKKIALFRAMIAFPLLFIIASYVLRMLASIGVMSLPIDVYPFLTTKSIFIHGIFIFISLWLKFRERLFVKLGAPREQFAAFERTNKNSLAFSLKLSLLLVVAALVSFVGFAVLAGIAKDEAFMIYSEAIALDEGISLLFAVPFVMLFSYTRTNNNKTLDVVLPLAGIALTILTYVEVFYNFVLMVLS